ncbi:MAG TPA: Fic family protein [archaeon]|nr:Fic family protein [archaeon]
MKKFTILKFLTETSDGLYPKDISKKAETTKSNVYGYLRELRRDNLIITKSNGQIIPNQKNQKVLTILNIQSMAHDNFDQLISPKFGILLNKLSQSLTVKHNSLSQMENLRIKKIGIPRRIILQISKRPGIYILKLNEALTKELIKYFDIYPSFSEIEFNKLLEKIPPRKERTTIKTTESDPEVKIACDKFHISGYDDILSKIKTFILDERSTILLDKVNLANKEYVLFLNSLDLPTRTEIISRWKSRYIYNTNQIEGNTLTEEEVETLLKTGLQPVNATAREIHETNNMRHALEYLELKKNEEINIELMKEIHFQIQKDIKPDAGRFKTSYNCVSNNPTTPPQFVKEGLEKLVQWYKENKTMNPFVLASIFHMQFEIIHPFSDGNGRVGRLVSNHIMQQNGFLPVTILQKTKQEYYRAIQNQSIQHFLLYSLSTFIEEYKR